MQQVQVRHALQADLVVAGLDFTHVQMEDFGHAYSPGGAAVRVTGGPRRSAGEATSGRVSIFSGASSGNRLSYEVSNGARLLVRDLWYESSVGPGFARVSGRAEFTDGWLARLVTGGRRAVGFAIDDLDGRVAILATHLDDGIKVAGAGGNAKCSHLPCSANSGSSAAIRTFPSARAWRRAQQPPDRPAAPCAQRTGARRRDGRSRLSRTMLRHAREERPAVLTARPANVTDVRMFRVLVQRSRENVRLAAGQPN